MIHWLWLHHAIIAGQVGTILYFGNVVKSVESVENTRLMINAVRETLTIVQKRGVNIDDYPSDTALYLNNSLEEVRSNLKSYFAETLWGKRSTEQSHLNTNPGDMKLIFWDVYNTGKELGVPTPCKPKSLFFSPSLSSPKDR